MRQLLIFAVPLGLLGSSVQAQDPAVTATCRDGSNWSGAHRSGACRGHGGVRAFGSASAATAGSPTPTAPTPRTTPTTTSTRSSSTSSAQAPGGGAGQVWVNTSTKVYHCSGDRWYGKTKRGSYMTESAAKAAGDRPDHGKACSA